MESLEEEKPDDFDGWVIHGHHHGNDIRRFPFFCRKKKRINVSVELVKYSPVPLDYICDLIMGENKKIIALS